MPASPRQQPYTELRLLMPVKVSSRTWGVLSKCSQFPQQLLSGDSGVWLGIQRGLFIFARDPYLLPASISSFCQSPLLTATKIR